MGAVEDHGRSRDRYERIAQTVIPSIKGSEALRLGLHLERVTYGIVRVMLAEQRREAAPLLWEGDQA